MSIEGTQMNKMKKDTRLPLPCSHGVAIVREVLITEICATHPLVVVMDSCGSPDMLLREASRRVFHFAGHRKEIAV
jgi:hypothetical protein